MDQEFDLFGDPVRRADGRRGRPAHVATQKNRNKVMLLLAAGWSNDRIANALHCSAPTLRKHYFSELKRRDLQRDRLVAWQFEKAFDLAAAGNVQALKELRAMIKENDLMLASARLGAEGEPPEEKLGKKEQARRDASAAMDGGAWGDDLKPGAYN